MELETNVVDTEGTDLTATSTETPEKEAGAEAQSTQGVTEPRKWKLKVNGEEEELDEPSVLKYAQLGKAGQRAMERAAATEKKHKELINSLRETAEKDPFLLYQALTGKRHPNALTAPTKATVEGQGNEPDPRDMQLREYEEKLSRIEQRLEQEDIERERKAVEQELGDAIKKYPELDSPPLKAYVKSQYRAALVNGAEMSIEDIAFLVAQEQKQWTAQKQKATQQKLEANKQKAPVITGPTGDAPKKKGTLEDSLALGGLMPS